MTVVNFWRTVGMKKPLEYKPLAVCDPQSINIEDIVKTGIKNFPGTVGGALRNLGLRYNPD